MRDAQCPPSGTAAMSIAARKPGSEHPGPRRVQNQTHCTQPQPPTSAIATASDSAIGVLFRLLAGTIQQGKRCRSRH